MSVSNKEEKRPPDDDEEKLVQQVLAENPPEDRGERDEWANHVGWHRIEDSGVGVVNLKEDIHTKKDVSGNPPKSETLTIPTVPKEREDVSKSLRGGSRSKENDGFGASDVLLAFIAIGCVFSTLRAMMRNRHSKQRTS
jgi:hypothetical protein